jgi:hypothetical protein
MSVAVQQAAYEQAARLSIAVIAADLQNVLGQRLTALIAGVSDAGAVSRWIKGRRRPHPEAEKNLRDAYQIVQLLQSVEGKETIRAWFLGMNPELGDESPALVIRERPREVLDAAKAFVAHG